MKLSVILLLSDEEGWSWGGDNDGDDHPATPKTTPKPTPKPTPRPTTVSPTGGSRRPPNSTPANPGRYDNCMKQCPRTTQQNPICGTDNITYRNEGMFKCAKHCGADVEIRHDGKCEEAPAPTTRKPSTPKPNSRIENCIKACPKLPQYNPICGTDGVTHKNDGFLSCARNCGKSVEIAHRGNCQGAPSSEMPPTPTNKPRPPTHKPNTTPTTEEPSDLDDIVNRQCLNDCRSTLEFKPVCGSDGKQYANMDSFNCQVKCGKKIEVVSHGKCPSIGASSGSTPHPNSRQDACLKKCPILQQYNPICGTNNQTYKNEALFKCAQNCGVDVELSFLGKCS